MANAIIKSSTSIANLSNNGTDNSLTWDKTNKIMITSGTSTSHIKCGLKSYDFVYSTSLLFGQGEGYSRTDVGIFNRHKDACALGSNLSFRSVLS